ncbi:hypothetical protein FXO37_16485 [Capsicum annuum]|nr:hypothetical protein FXO37_16485 [Capsicum annuum]
MMSLTNSSLPFFPLLNPLLLTLGPHFVRPNGENLFQLNQTPLSMTLSCTPQNIEVAKREKTLEALRVSNREMETLLDQLRIPMTDALTLKRPVNLVFEGLA